ncbi:hypothetical protein FRC07_013787 [Ceratobasidium sp. 392]|nr:hypothetical protein FRC07_013787 [Ceratobasidium sp. 392]
MAVVAAPGQEPALGQLIVNLFEINAAAVDGNNLLRARLHILHRPYRRARNVDQWIDWKQRDARSCVGSCVHGRGLLQPPESLPGDCDKVGGEGLRSIKEGSESTIGLDYGVDRLTLAALQSAMPCVANVLVVRGGLVTIVWLTTVALTYRYMDEPAAAAWTTAGSPRKIRSGFASATSYHTDPRFRQALLGHWEPSALTLAPLHLNDLRNGSSTPIHGPADQGTNAAELHKLPAFVVLLVSLRAKIAAISLNIPKAEYREQRLGGYGGTKIAQASTMEAGSRFRSESRSG